MNERMRKMCEDLLVEAEGALAKENEMYANRTTPENLEDVVFFKHLERLRMILGMLDTINRIRGRWD